MFDYSDLVWDEKLDLKKVKNRYVNFVQDLTDFNNSLIFKTNHHKDADVEINETSFILTFGEIVNAQKVNDFLQKYQAKDLFYIFYSPINVQTSTSIDNDIVLSNDSKFSAYYSKGIIDVNSNSEVLKKIQIFDLYGNIISSISSLNTQNYIINPYLSSGVYFVLVNDKQIIKLSITE